MINKRMKLFLLVAMTVSLLTWLIYARFWGPLRTEIVIKPGDSLNLQKGDDILYLEFNQEGPVDDIIRLQVSYTPQYYPTGNTSNQIRSAIQLCLSGQSNCTFTLEDIPEFSVIRENSKVFIPLDKWRLSSVYSPENQMILWSPDKWVVIHTPSGDIRFQWVESYGDDLTVVFNVKEDELVSQYSTADHPTFAEDKIHPVSKFIVAPSDWRYEYESIQ